MPQFADFAQAAPGSSRHPQVRFVDLLLADQMGIPRGKRVTVDELEGVHRARAAAAGIDVRARRARRHGPGHRPGLRRGRRGPCLPADSRHAGRRCRGSASRSRRCRSACTSTTARRFTAIRATCSKPCSRALPRSGLRPGHGGRTGVLPRRPRTHGRGSCAAAAPAAHGAARTQDPDQLDAGTGRVLGAS